MEKFEFEELPMQSNNYKTGFEDWERDDHVWFHITTPENKNEIAAHGFCLKKAKNGLKAIYFSKNIAGCLSHRENPYENATKDKEACIIVVKFENLTPRHSMTFNNQGMVLEMRDTSVEHVKLGFIQVPAEYIYL